MTNAVRMGLFCVLFLSGASVADAGLVTYQFSGTISDANNLPVSIGSSFSGTFSYDDAMIDSSSSVSLGRYASPTITMSATLSGIEITRSGAMTLSEVLVQDGTGTGGTDYFRVEKSSFTGFIPSTTHPTIITNSLVFQIVDNVDKDAISTDALANLDLDLSRFGGTKQLFVSGQNNGAFFRATGNITALTLTSQASVPEPHSAIIFTAGMAGLAFLRRRRSSLQ